MGATDLLLVHAAVTWAMVGVIWLVQLVQYPGFPRVGGAEFGAFHGHHASRITWIVAPLMGAELATGLALVGTDLPGLSGLFLWTGLALIAVNAAWTAFVSVPLHGSLSGRTPERMHKLVCTNWVRTIAWSARGVWALVALRWALAAS